MSIFTEAATDIKGLEEKLLGPDYEYWKHIKTPSEMGMSGKGSLSALGNDINGLIGYVEVLVKGGGKASKVSGPLGNKFFLQTGGKCKDVVSKEKKERNIYVNNVADGSMPFISAGLNTNFTSFEGLVPGIASNISHISPMAMLQSFTMGGTPDCQAITMETVDNNNIKSKDTQFVTTVDAENMNPCWFPDRKNPITGKKCQEAFSGNRGDWAEDTKEVEDEVDDTSLNTVNLVLLSGLGLYAAHMLMRR